ncbi:serine hydrolase [uncultured Pseudacidovorax sp.]|uniref:serine hydrolase domain-containing protein n=1 Tax=uncultured Pseudacidovorax sp. TaxID=679313 RepID=UPI0025D78C26|nr:serine hydrolase [uncultured Pseudacidovorax sp.]
MNTTRTSRFPGLHAAFALLRPAVRAGWIWIVACAGLFAPLAALAQDAATSPQPFGAEAAAVARVLDRADPAASNIHSVLVMREGQRLAERYYAGKDQTIYSLWRLHRGFGAEDLHDMRSLSKSVLALVYGILLARGEVPDPDTPVASLYPQCADQQGASSTPLRVRHLLTMTTGLDWDEPSPVHRPKRDDQSALLWTGSVAEHVLCQARVAEPGTRFVYSGGATAVLADIMARRTGRTLEDLVGRELFDPLGISGWTWTHDLRGRALAFAGLRLRPQDLLKLGTLVLDQGRWQGRQVVPAAWVEAATSAQVPASADYGYGFQWWTRTWRIGDTPVRVVQAIGNGGQRLYVVPALRLVVAMTAGNYGEPGILAEEDALFSALATVLRPDSAGTAASR